MARKHKNSAFSISFLLLLFAVLLVIIFSIGMKTSPVTAQETGVDLALTINGSGSISAADFALQKEGIRAALEDPLIIHRDGSVALTIVQYANGQTQVHVPYTVVSSTAIANNIVDQVDAIVQISGSTNPGDGINTAMSVLNANGNPNNTQVICLSTDGLPNSGADVATALNNAQNSTIGLEKFSVVAIEDPPFYFEPDFQNYYGGLVFGGGAVTVVRNSVEYANILGATCLAPESELIGLEVVQTIQDWTNSVTLIENKTTYVRAHIKPKEDDEVVARARLRGYRNGVELQESPLSAESPGFIVAHMDAVERRGDFDSSLNFRLPSSWLNGTVELRIEGIGGLECKEVADTPNDCSTTVTFHRTETMDLKLVAITWYQLGGLITHRTSLDDLDELYNRLHAIFPVANGSQGIDRIDGEMTFVEPNNPPANCNMLCQINLRLATLRAADDCFPTAGCQRMYYGALRGPEQGGLAILGNNVNTASGTMPEGDFEYGRNRHAHELAHLFGLLHTPACRSPQDTEPFPYTATINNRSVNTIGPMDLGEDRLIFGLDTHQMRVVDPNANYELMSYCTPWRWISDVSYEAVQIELNDMFEGNENDLPQSVEYLAFRGVVSLADNSATFVPSIVFLSSLEIIEPEPGEFALRLFNGQGDLIREISFSPSELSPDYPNESDEQGLFIIPVPNDPLIKSASLVNQGEIIASISASTNSPEVNVVYPNGGEALSGNFVSLQWHGNDLDGDPLTYMVQYSRDGGSKWETLVVDWVENSYDISLESLGETSQGLIRVVASDGFNASSDISDGFFSTPNTPPQATISSPRDNDTYVGVQLIFFESILYDREDTQIPDANIIWTSSLDGLIGTGNNFQLEATELSEGDHIITLTVTDSGGSTDTESVHVRVLRLPPPMTVEASIDIIPNSSLNEISPFSRKAIAVVILSTEVLDATTIDPLSVEFGPNGALTQNGRFIFKDIGFDGDLDMVLFFRPSESGIQCGDTSASLIGETFDGLAIQGSDSIVTVGCN